jgi:hypothetical protein
MGSTEPPFDVPGPLDDGSDLLFGERDCEHWIELREMVTKTMVPVSIIDLLVP